MHYRYTRDRFTISTDPAHLQVDIIHQFLSTESYWAKGIPREVVERSIAHSLCFGLYDGSQQVGFARTVTDRATFAYLADVFILPAYRGLGLAKWMMETIQACPDLQGLRRWMLGTRDAHELYKQFGWVLLDKDTCSRFMQRHFRDVYLPSTPG